MTATARSDIDFDPEALQAWLQRRLPQAQGAMKVTRIGGGQSNPTYFVDFDSLPLVLRKRPPGELPRSAHDVEREYRILQALHGTAVPVPAPVLFEGSPEVVGTPFYLMQRVDGRVFEQSTLPAVPRAQRRAYFDEMARVLAALHAVDWQASSLAALARPERYLPRQVDRWTRAWGALAQTDPEVARIADWLRAHLPPTEDRAIVHGDYKFNNLIFDPAQPRIAAVLDWELCAIGDPLSDLAHCWAFTWATRPEEYGGVLGTDLAAEGLPEAEAFFEAYARACGGGGRRLTPFHRVMALFRCAGIFHGIAQRAASGIANAANAEEKGRLDRIYLARALALIDAPGFI